MKRQKRNIVTLFTVLAACFICCYIWPYQGLRYSYEYEYPAVNGYTLVELKEDSVIMQEFQTDNIHLKGLQYYLIQNSDEPEGILHMELSSQDEGIIVIQETALSEIGNADWYFNFFPATLKKNRLYEIRFYVENCREGDYPYMVILDKADACKQNRNCYVNDNLQDGSLFLSYMFARQESTYVKISVSLLAVLSCLAVILAISKADSHNPPPHQSWGSDY